MPMEPSKPFPTVSLTFTADMVALYGQTQGDRNMIHYDIAAAQAAGFPRPIAHGALAIALVTQACREYWGATWFTTGRLSVRLLRASFVGDPVTVEGEPTAVEELDGGKRVTVEVWCTNGEGTKIVTGQASGLLLDA